MAITELHLRVSRTARYYRLGEPGPAVRELWFVCHGYAQLARSFLRRFTALEAPHRLVIAPEGLSRFYLGDHTRPATGASAIGASWMTREDRDADIADYVEYLDALATSVAAGVPPGLRVRLLGFSQGTATVSRWAAHGAVPATQLILWGGLLANDLDLVASRNRLAALDLTLVAGQDDPYLTPKVRAGEAERLRAAGIPFGAIQHAGGHEIHEPTLLALAAD